MESDKTDMNRSQENIVEINLTHYWLDKYTATQTFVLDRDHGNVIQIHIAIPLINAILAK